MLHICNINNILFHNIEAQRKEEEEKKKPQCLNLIIQSVKHICHRSTSIQPQHVKCSRKPSSLTKTPTFLSKVPNQNLKNIISPQMGRVAK